MLDLRKNARRVRHLHHHLPGARGVHFPAAAQRARTAHRPRTPALRSVRRAGAGAAGAEKVVSLPNRATEAAAKKPDDRRAGSHRPSAGKALPKPARRSPPGSTRLPPPTANSTPQHFLTGARAAYEMIVNAFAEGDRRTLKNLLSREVYDGFEGAIIEREKRGDTVESRFVVDRQRDDHRRRSCAAAPRSSPCASSPSWSRSPATRPARSSTAMPRR